MPKFHMFIEMPNYRPKIVFQDYILVPICVEQTYQLASHGPWNDRYSVRSAPVGIFVTACFRLWSMLISETLALAYWTAGPTPIYFNCRAFRGAALPTISLSLMLHVHDIPQDVHLRCLKNLAWPDLCAIAQVYPCSEFSRCNPHCSLRF